MAKPEPKPAPSRPERLGPCGVCRCVGYEHDRVQDGFRTCACHHTQVSHAKVPA